MKSVSSNVSDFIYASIADNQSTIRAIDTKLGFILVILSIPFTEISRIYLKIVMLLEGKSIWVLILIGSLVFIFVVFWLLAFLTSIRGISSIDNPINHIKNNIENIKGRFYLGGLFNLKIWDSLLNRKSIQSNIKHQELLTEYSEEKIDILGELTLEQMKLSYIRDIKISRQRWAYIFLLIWILIGSFLYLLTKVAI